MLKIIKIKLTDGSFVYDVALIQDGHQVARWGCNDREAAQSFVEGMVDLFEQYTVEGALLTS